MEIIKSKYRKAIRENEKSKNMRQIEKNWKLREKMSKLVKSARRHKT